MPMATRLVTLAAVSGGALSEKLRLENKIVRIVDIETLKMHITNKLILIIPLLGEIRGGRCSGVGQFNVCVECTTYQELYTRARLSLQCGVGARVAGERLAPLFGISLKNNCKNEYYFVACRICVKDHVTTYSACLKGLHEG